MYEPNTPENRRGKCDCNLDDNYTIASTFSIIYYLSWGIGNCSNVYTFYNSNLRIYLIVLLYCIEDTIECRQYKTILSIFRLHSSSCLPILISILCELVLNTPMASLILLRIVIEVSIVLTEYLRNMASLWVILRSPYSLYTTFTMDKYDNSCVEFKTCSIVYAAMPVCTYWMKLCSPE